ncbi:hypothetical protein GOB94_11340 [Granulicella sp. 5B5]|uniref:hypothetical protein n=1 Tax=Granulicella sp. 5B5 TaxID=1617967 RepID=UPI0015F5C8D6|nr:hypothetical protein [Granulicella sp. 5B5]QMV19203.1 hypothetical protein GOB94_11340 [Granulicella sp. 5B5]
MQTLRLAVVPLLLFFFCATLVAAVPKVHSVTLGPSRHVPYTPPEANPDNKSDEATTLRVRGLFVDDRQREWTVGEMHEVTDRSFVIRRALRINDALPGESIRWSWQPGPWLLVDRVTGHITALHLPSYDPDVSDAVWFRDYAAYCGVATTGKGGLVAVVAELGTRKAVVQKVIGPWPMANAPHPVCSPAKWQRTPIRVTFDLTAGESMTLDVLGASSFIEEGESSDQ